jgi:hypothetical protein
MPRRRRRGRRRASTPDRPRLIPTAAAQFDVDGTLGALTAAQTREMVTVLIEAADELERITGDGPPFM